MSKEITILYFATARDATKVSSEKISLPSQSKSISLEDLLDLLKKRHEKLAPVLDNAMYSINMEYVECDYQSILVKEGDEVAVIPPVSGG